MANLFKRLLGDREAQPETAEAAAGNDQPQAKPVAVTDANFEDIILQADKPAMVDMWAEWCVPCHRIAPTVADMAAEYEGRAVIAKLNVDENPNTPMRYGVMGIPALLFFKDGKLADQQTGVTGYPQLAGKLEKLLD